MATKNVVSVSGNNTVHPQQNYYPSYACVIPNTNFLISSLLRQRRRKQTRIGMTSMPFSLPFFPSPFPFLLPFSFLPLAPSLLFPPFFPLPTLAPPLPCTPPFPLKDPLNPARGPGERCKLPQRSLGRSRSRNRFGCISAFKSDIWRQQF